MGAAAATGQQTISYNNLHVVVVLELYARSGCMTQLALISAEINFSICPAPVPVVCYSDQRRLSQRSGVRRP